MIKRNTHDDVRGKEGVDRVRYNDADGNGEYVKEVEASNSKYKEAKVETEVEVEEKINAIVVKHLSSVLGEHTIKVINYHLNRMGVDIRNVCNDPKKVEGVLYSLFKESSRMLISEVVNALYTDFNIIDGKVSTLDDAITRIKALDG
ncbi:MAG: hypothetical protein QW572_01330 [Candidatus Nitrosocaldus sp.]